MFSFLVGTALLIGALWATSQLGVAGGGLASKAIGQFQNRGSAAAKAVGKRIGGAALSATGARLVGAAGGAAATRVRTGLAKTPGLKYLTKGAREESGLKAKAKISKVVGGKAGVARAARFEAQHEAARATNLKEQGVIGEQSNLESRKAGLEAAATEVDKKLILSDMIKNEDPGTEKALDEHFALPKEDDLSKADAQRTLKARFELEKLREQKNKTAVGMVKRDEKRGFGNKERRKAGEENKEYEKEHERKANSQSVEKFHGHLSNLKDDAEKDALKVDPKEKYGKDTDYDKLLAMRPDHREMVFNSDNFSNYVGALTARRDALEASGDEDMKKKYGGEIDKKIKQMYASFRGDRTKIPKLPSDLSMFGADAEAGLKRASDKRQELHKLNSVEDKSKKAESIGKPFLDDLRLAVESEMKGGLEKDGILSKDIDDAVKKFIKKIDELEQKHINKENVDKELQSVVKELENVFDTLPEADSSIVKDLPKLTEEERDEKRKKDKKKKEEDDKKKEEDGENDWRGDGYL
jgi:hypothetical protein